MIRRFIIGLLLPVIITNGSPIVEIDSATPDVSLSKPRQMQPRIANNFENTAIRILKQDDAQSDAKIYKKTKFRKGAPNKHVLAKLGVTKVAQDSSARYDDKSDSNLVIVKLPPNPNYYVNLQPCDERSYKNCLNKSSKNLPFSFNINGKPNKIYHYNLPLIDKTQKRNINNRIRSSVSKVLSHKRQTKNNISVYQPLPNSLPMNSYFKGNGKFQNLYIMSKKKKRRYE